MGRTGPPRRVALAMARAACSEDNLPPAGKIYPSSEIRQYQFGRVDGAGDLAADLLEMIDRGDSLGDIRLVIEFHKARHLEVTRTGLLH